MNDVTSTNPATPTQVTIQKMGAALAKACLNSIPLAALAIELGQIVVDVQNDRVKGSVNLANAKITQKFIDELGRRLDQLETSVKVELSNSSIHQSTAHSALQALLTETNENVSVVLARAVERLGLAKQEPSYKSQFARVIADLNEPMLHAMQTNHRYHTSQLTSQERKTFEGLTEDIERMASLLNKSMSVPNWDYFMRHLMQLGIVQNRESAGFVDERRIIVQTAPSTTFGEELVSMCFDDLSNPRFGRFSG